MRMYLLVIALLSGAALGQTATSYTEIPKPADSFVDSIGVNVHLFFLDTSYGNSAAVQNIVTTLKIRHVRDGARLSSSDPNFNQQQFAAYGKISKLGVGFDLILDATNGPNPPTPATMAAIQSLATQNGVIIDSYEGPNEIDNSGDLNWIADARSFMQSMYSSVKANPSTTSTPVLGNTLAGASRDWVALGDMTKHEDFGNLHPYANTQNPSYNFAADLANQKNVSGAQPIYVTEAGWSNAIKATDDTPNITEDVAAKYIGRLFFESLLQGWRRTYVYEMLDEKPDPGLTSFQQHFGLFRNDYSPKPSGNTLGNLISLMWDQGFTFAPASLTYTLATNSPNVHHLLFQKHDGSYWLALWQEVSCWKGWNAQGTPISNPDVPVTVTLPTAASLIQIYRPCDSTASVQSFSNQTSITVMVPDHPVLIQMGSMNPGMNLRVISVQ